MAELLVRSSRITGPLSLLVIAVWLGLVVNAPLEAVQGLAQKIFYVHVPCWPAAYLGFIFTGVGGIGFLANRGADWDHFAQAAAEVGIVFCTLGLITGPIWAKPIWGHWWVWDLRLTSTLVLWFIYVAYLFLRAFAFGSDRARALASVYGIAGTLVIPFVYFAVDLARGSTMHPSNPIGQDLPAAMGYAILAGTVAFLMLFAFFLSLRFDLARLEAAELEKELG